MRVFPPEQQGPIGGGACEFGERPDQLFRDTQGSPVEVLDPEPPERIDEGAARCQTPTQVERSFIVCVDLWIAYTTNGHQCRAELDPQNRFVEITLARCRLALDQLRRRRDEQANYRFRCWRYAARTERNLPC